MIDSITAQRILVKEHAEYGPYIRVSSYEDTVALEEFLDDRYHVPYYTSHPDDLQFAGGGEYYFGWAVDVVKLQSILDSINLD